MGILYSARKDYNKFELSKSKVSENPFSQFSNWFTNAQQIEDFEAHAMTLATASKNGFPSARIVLLKDYNENGFTFFTNYESRKAEEILNNPNVALLFFWAPLEQQIRIEGTIEKITIEESKRYFRSRPRRSQIAAITSLQSKPVVSREELEAKFANLEAEYNNKQIPFPTNWGGYLVKPSTFEFWQGRSNRLHDRLKYSLKNNKWIIERLAP